MDGDRFDAIARFLDAIQTRRGTLKQTCAGLLGLAVFSNFDLAEAGKRHKRRTRRRRRRRNRRKHRCKGGTTRCNGACVDTNTDPNNCGGCGDECDAGEVCRQGECACDVCGDASDCPFTSVQAAVDAANPGDTIAICKGTYSGNVAIDKDLTLIGAGQEDTTLEGDGDGSVVTVAEDVTVTVQGVAFTGGTGTPVDGQREGGGIFNQGNLTLNGCVVFENQALFGGGIFNRERAQLALDATVVGGNVAQSDDPDQGTYGGGLYNRFGALLTITNGSRVAGNQADNAAGVYNNGILNITGNSAVSDNEADFDGGGLLNDEGNITIDNSSVLNNTSHRRGAGILNFNGTLQLQNESEVAANKAGTDGGGIYNEEVASVIAADCAIIENEAAQSGGGIFNNGGHVSLTRTAVGINEAKVRGGGIFNSGDLTLTACEVTGNDANDTGGGIFNLTPGEVTLAGGTTVTQNDPNNCVGTSACGA